MHEFLVAHWCTSAHTLPDIFVKHFSKNASFSETILEASDFFFSLESSSDYGLVDLELS